MTGAYRSQAYDELERRAIDLSMRYDHGHDALELAADCQDLLEQAGFARAWMTEDQQPTEWTNPRRYICTKELYYCRKDALVLLRHVTYSPFSSDPDTVACAYLAPAAETISKVGRFRSQRPSCIHGIAGILLHRAIVLSDIKYEIDKRGVTHFEKALLHAVRRQEGTAASLQAK